MQDFIFADDLTFYCSNGRSMVFSKSDIKSYADDGIDMDEIKTLSYSYLTNTKFNTFIIDEIQNLYGF